MSLNLKSSYHELEQSKLIFNKEINKWYLKNRRKLPWRSNKKDPNFPYRVLVSEFMLQQTGVSTVVPYFKRFIQEWPNIDSLAKATEDEVLNHWQGLGYYSRGRNLLKTAKILCQNYNNSVPQDIKNLISLPGIGEYASAAIRSIAFNKKATVVDGNVKRVIARFFALKGKLSDNETDISNLAKFLTPNKCNSNYSQAIMEFGALICRPKKPSCDICIFKKDCLSFKQKIVSNIPEPKLKVNKKDLRCASFLAINNNSILVIKRKEKNLLENMWQLPSSEWVTKNTSDKLVSQAPFKANWIQNQKKIKYKFSHIDLLNETYVTKVNSQINLVNENYKWINIKCLDKYPLVTLTKKILENNSLI